METSVLPQRAGLELLREGAKRHSIWGRGEGRRAVCQAGRAEACLVHLPYRDPRRAFVVRTMGQVTGSGSLEPLGRNQ